MPFYTYICEDCESEFDMFTSIKKKEAGWKPVCSNCGSVKTRQIFSAVAMTSDIQQPSHGSSCCA